MDKLAPELHLPPAIGLVYIDNPSSLTIDSDSSQVHQLGEVAHRFKWKDHLIGPARINQQFSEFTDRYQFPINSDILTTIVTDSFAFADQVYDTLFGSDGCPLPYHDITHTKLTGITATKIFLGGLVSQPDLSDQLVQSNKLQPVIQTFVIASCLHEIDDWLNLPGVADLDNMLMAISQISQHLTTMSLSTHDFDKIISLDDFAKSLPDSLDSASQLQPNDGFLGKVSPNGNDSIFGVDLPLLKLAQTSIQAADFLQIANPAYYSQVYFYSDEKNPEACTGCLHSLVALAWEMINFRPKGFKNNPDWLNEDGSLNLAKLKPSPYFIKNFAFPRIINGLSHLNKFSEDESKRAIQSLDIVTNFAEKSNPPDLP